MPELAHSTALCMQLAGSAEEGMSNGNAMGTRRNTLNP